jgi:hypothetical protein
MLISAAARRPSGNASWNGREPNGRPFPRCQDAKVGPDRFREFDLVHHPSPNDAVVEASSPVPPVLLCCLFAEREIDRPGYSDA